MIDLTTSSVVEAVRKNLDELDPSGNASVMYTDESADNTSLSNTILRFLPEAINMVQKAAPVTLLEGKVFAAGDLQGSASISDGVLSFTLSAATKFFRLVSFRAADSDIVVTDAIPEASAEGRKQLNPFIRGRKDRPRLVQLQGAHNIPKFKYYTLDTGGSSYSNYQTSPSSAIGQMEYVQEQVYSDEATSYPISRPLRQNVIDCTTAMVMETYGDQRAQSYYQKAIPTL